MNFFTWLLQVNICLVLFYSCYKLFLEHETFFRLNRFYLLASAVLSLLIPFIRPLWLSSLPVTREVGQAAFMMSQEISLAAPAPAAHQLSSGEFVYMVYCAGVLFFFILFVRRISLIYSSAWGTILQMPCSFFKRIFIPENAAGKEMILTHENLHAAELHSADVLFFELITILNWFNPFCYFYKNSIRHVHEFIADKHTVEHHHDKSSYALLLLSESFGKLPGPLTNSFYHPSLLKKRIIMLQKSASGRLALLKYSLALPLLGIMLVLSSATVTNERIEKVGNSIRKTFTHTPLEPRKIFQQAEVNRPVKKSDRIDRKLPVITPMTVSLPDTVPAKPVYKQLNEVIVTPEGDNSPPVDFSKIETPPTFPGGQRGIATYFVQNFVWPKAAKDAGVSGRVIISFIVENNGTLSAIKVLRDLGLGTGEAAVKVLAAMPKWSPGMLNGQPVRVAFTLPIALSVEGKSDVAPPRPVYIIDGKMLDAAAMTTMRQTDSISYNRIRKIMTTPALNGQVKRLTPTEATEKYGESGKNGAIVIETKP